MINRRINDFKNETNDRLIIIINIINFLSNKDDTKNFNRNENLYKKSRHQLQSTFIEMLSDSCNIKRTNIEIKDIRCDEEERINELLNRTQYILKSLDNLDSILSWIKNNKRACLFLITLLRLSINKNQGNFEELYINNIYKNNLKADEIDEIDEIDDNLEDENHENPHSSLDDLLENTRCDSFDILEPINFIDENSDNIDKELFNIIIRYQISLRSNEEWICSFIKYCHRHFKTSTSYVSDNWNIIKCTNYQLKSWLLNNLKRKYELYYYSEPKNNEQTKQFIINHLDIIYYFQKNNNHYKNDIKNIKNLFSRKMKDYEDKNIEYSIKLNKEYWEKLEHLEYGTSKSSKVMRLIDEAIQKQELE